MRSSEPSRLDRLSRGNQRDAALNEAFVVLSIGASLIALVAGALATYANLSRDAVSSLAGTAIAVALVPPVCVMGLLLAHQH